MIRLAMGSEACHFVNARVTSPACHGDSDSRRNRRQTDSEELAAVSSAGKNSRLQSLVLQRQCLRLLLRIDLRR